MSWVFTNNILRIKLSSRVNTVFLTQGSVLLSWAELYSLKTCQDIHNGKYFVTRKSEGENIHIQKFTRKGSIDQQKGAIILTVDEFRKIVELDSSPYRRQP